MTNFPGNDKVNHPEHYKVPGLPECVEIIEGLGWGYNLATTFKYMYRTDRKSYGPGAIEDLQKARWFLDREIENRVRKMRPKPDLVEAQMRETKSFYPTVREMYDEAHKDEMISEGGPVDGKVETEVPPIPTPYEAFREATKDMKKNPFQHAEVESTPRESWSSCARPTEGVDLGEDDAT